MEPNCPRGHAVTRDVRTARDTSTHHAPHPPLCLLPGAAPPSKHTLTPSLSHAAPTRTPPLAAGAITSSRQLAEELSRFVSMVSFGMPRESQLRAIALLEHVVHTRGEIFGYARRLMLGRWERLEAIFRGSAHFRLDARDPAAHDTFSDQDGYAPSPAYAWIERLDGGDAPAAFEAAGIRGRSGDQFGSSRRFVRVELLMREATFRILAAKLEALAARGAV